MYKIIDSFSEFKNLHDAWNELVEGKPVDHVFMKHEWFDCWINSQDVADRLVLVTGWRDGQLVAIAPLMYGRTKMKFLPLRTINFLQSAVSPRCNFIVSSTEELNGLFENIRRLKNWDVFLATNMEESVPETKAFLQCLVENRRGTSFAIEDGRQSPYLDIEGTWEDYLKSQLKKRRNYIKSECINRLTKKTEQHAIIHITDAKDFDNLFSQMLDISSRSWKQESGTAIGQVKSQYLLYKTFTPIALRNGWVEIWMLEINNKKVAFDYHLTLNNIHSLIRSDFDSEFNWYHPGENLKIASLKELFSRGVKSQLDLGGSPAPYKLRWADKIRRHLSITVACKSPRGRSALFLKSTVRPIIQSVINR